MGIARRPVYLVRYEDMLEHPQRIFAGLAGYLNLRPTTAQLEAAIRKSSFSVLSQQEEQNGFRERPVAAKRFFRQGRAEAWREVLSERQVQTVLGAHAPMMQRMGYLSPTVASTN
jgi:hypothetical protein